MEIQPSFKRSPQGQKHAPAECTLMEIRVENIDGLIPLLPHSCSPISDMRWQTKDYDGNRILLQVLGSLNLSRRTIPFTSTYYEPSNGYGPDINHKYSHHNIICSHSQNEKSFQIFQPLQHKKDNIESVQCSQEIVCSGWADDHSHSLISIATEAFRSGSAHTSGVRPCSSFSLTMPRVWINVDMLVGAEETDLDRGQAVTSKSLDLSVVSAYILPQREIPQPPSEHQPLYSITSPIKPLNKMKLPAKSACPLKASSKWNKGENQSKGSDRNKGIIVDAKQEFLV